MTGSIIQIASFGIQDIYLTTNPNITYFKIVYRRYTNFSIESIQQFFTTRADFNSKLTCNVSHSGDLIHKVYVVVDLPAIPKFIDPKTQTDNPFKYFAWVKSLGFAMINEVTVEINHKIIDKQYGEWMYIWNSLSGKQDKSINQMIGNVEIMTDYSNGKPAYRLYIPLFFWFCKNIGLSLPVIALSNSELKITVLFREIEECYKIGPTNSIQTIEGVVPFKQGDYIYQIVNGQRIDGQFISFDYINKILYYIKIQDDNNPKQTFTALQEPTQNITVLNSINYINNVPFRIYNQEGFFTSPQANQIETVQSVLPSQQITFTNSFLYIDYIFLSSEERAKFARSNHEYLIEQIQYDELKNIKSQNVKLTNNLNHPVKEMIWVVQQNKLVGAGTINDRFNFTNSFLPNGKELVSTAELFLNGQPRFGIQTGEYFNRIQTYYNHYRHPPIGIDCYSFGIRPEDHQPSGTCNMSKIDYINFNFRLDPIVSSFNQVNMRVYSINYNVLRIFFGLGAVAFK